MDARGVAQAEAGEDFAQGVWEDVALIHTRVWLQSETGAFRWELWREGEMVPFAAGDEATPYRAFVAAQEALTNQYTLTERL